MILKRTLTSLAVAAAAALTVASLAAASLPGSASVVIRHQVRGCHAWAVNGGPFAASQTITLARNASLTVKNNDVMPHKLVQTAGPAAFFKNVPTPMGMGLKGTFAAGMMAHVGAITKVTFRSVGVYRFTTKAGEDYMSGMKTIGEDNVLVLIVRVH